MSTKQTNVRLDTIDVSDTGNPRNNGRWVRLSDVMVLVAKAQLQPDPIEVIERALTEIDDRD